MKQILLALSMFAFLHAPAHSQGIDFSNTQIHGFATQAFLYTTNNNWNSTDSSDGSAAWTEAVVNLTSEPEPKLRIGIQARYFLLGDYGNTINLDWAQGDYKVNEHFGFRVGKVKTPGGLFNEIQDIDPAYLWVLLPQSSYPLANRGSRLAHYGGVVYGAIPIGDSFGKLEYRAFGGERVIGTDDGTFKTLQSTLGFTGTEPFTFPTVGATLRWNTPIHGLLLGFTGLVEHFAGKLDLGPYSGNFNASWVPIPCYFASYERGKWMFGGEYGRYAPNFRAFFPGLGALEAQNDQRTFYLMSSYKLSHKLTAGLYYSSFNDHQAAFTPARYQKDWALAARYDFNSFLYLKAEQHFMDGTGLGYLTSDNPGGLKPDTRMTLLKFGVSF